MKLILRKLLVYLNIIRKDLKDKFPLVWYKKIFCWYNGFLAEKYTLYQFDKNDYTLYLSDFHQRISRTLNEPFNEILTNKLIFEEVVGKFIKVPETYGWIFSGKYYPQNSFNPNLLKKRKS